ncbi:PREDICTED: complement factor H-like [Poecilia mexicana]|uniref:complement factor H-like n=1 Tax=Poecilia mexicana TaxID=48701 RepID=UPI00072E9FA4|nr:PREDICTED: complement factor H-like [Poecilia mexicana]
MHMITRSCVLLLWSQLLTSVTCQDCTREQFLNSRHFDSNFDVSGLDATYSGGKQVRVPCSVGYTGYFKLICTEGNWIPSGRKCEPKSCGHPGDAQFGDFRLVVGDDYVFGSQIVYECNPGYHMVSRSSRRRCLADGWDGTIAVCEGMNSASPSSKLTINDICPIIPAIKCDLALASIPGTTYDPSYKNMFSPGETVRVTCGEKHWILDMQTTVADVTCGIRGDWDTSPICQEVTCPRYIDEAHLYRSVNAWGRNKIGDRVRYDCANNYDPASSDRMATCTREGWTPKPLCRGRRCENPNIENSRITRGSRTYYNGDRLTYECLGRNQEPVTITCEGGAWVGIKPCPEGTRCQKPEITNGFAVEPNEGTIYYACNENFKLPTKSWWGLAKCENGVFGQLHSCIAKTLCGEASPISNGKMTISRTRARIECNEGYVAQIAELTCDNGRWNYHGFTAKTICRATAEHCGSPPKVENAVVTISYQKEYLHGSSVTYLCRDKYMMEEEPSITCNAGKWETRNITCVRMCMFHSKCSPNIINGIVLGLCGKLPKVNFSSENIKSTQAMKPLWFMFLVLQAFLNVEFSWSQNVITCEIGGLDPNMYVSGLTPIGGTIKPGHKLSFLCAPGYQLDGSKETECLPTGQWTASFPSCSGIPCKVEPLSVGLRRVGSASQNLVNPGDILRFLCEDEYDMEGSDEVQCLDMGNWNGPFPTCSGVFTSYLVQLVHLCNAFNINSIKCDLALASIPGTTYDPSYKNMFSPGETVRVTCGEKHWILDMQTTVADVTCGIRGDWDTNPICQEVTCPRYINEEHLYSSVSAWGRNKIGDRVRYDCAYYYDPASSDRMATCTREGWTPKPLCRGTRCENPNIENSRITRGSKRTYYNGDRLTYECLGGNQEPVTITCERGAWVGIKPCPAPSNCSAPPALEDGDTKAIIRSDSEYQHGERVEYLCQNKYTMAGGPFKTCDNGVWKGDIRCLKPCTVTQQLMNEHNVQFAHFEDSKIFVPHTDHIAFVCKSGKRLDGTVPLRVQCNDGEINLPTCQ